MKGPQLLGTIQNPQETHLRTAPVPEDEIGLLIKDFTEIKSLLFCRTLLSYATLLPLALTCNSVEEFLASEEITLTELRDLCLKVEKPSLQALRDACADFVRGDEPELVNDEQEEEEQLSTAELFRRNRKYGRLEDVSLLQSLFSSSARKALAETAGILDKQVQIKPERMKITVCGRSIWNYANESAMPRAGWLQFSIMAKDYTFEEAIALCRNWDEFFEVNILVLYQFFPTSKWSAWSENMLVSELLQLGFIMYYYSFGARERTVHRQTGNGGGFRRQHHHEEARNIVCAHMARGDAATNRFIQYVIMNRGEMLIMVRDGKTGRVLTMPDRDQMWLHRRKIGLGRAAKNGWEVLDAVDSWFFDEIEDKRKWSFGFDSYYDVYIWDHVPGQSPMDLFESVVDLLRRARRIRHPRDKYIHAQHILAGLTQDPTTKRVHQHHPGDTSIWDQLTGPDVVYAYSNSKTNFDIRAVDQESISAASPYVFYNDTDAAEDSILFEDDREKTLFKELSNPIDQLDQGPPTIFNHKAQEFHDKFLSNDTSEAKADTLVSMYKPGAEEFIYSVPPIWKDAFSSVAWGENAKERSDLLTRTDYFTQVLQLTSKQLTKEISSLEIMERDRSSKYLEVMTIVLGIQRQTNVKADNEWVWFCVGILDELELKVHYNDYVQSPHEPWPHRYLAQDMANAFVMMGLFFPNLSITDIIQEYFLSEEGAKHQESMLFNPSARAGQLPERRTRASNIHRPKTFWKELNTILHGNKHFTDLFPVPWNMAIRPIIAKLYRAGIIQPAYLQPNSEVCPGNAMTATEEHRPDQLDLFIHFRTPRPDVFRNYVAVKDWPDLLAAGRTMAKDHTRLPNETPSNGTSCPARFALLRLWSSPHFLPLMLGYNNRQGTSFMDGVGRSWEWKFIPKDMPESEWTSHNTTSMRLERLFERVPASADLKKKVAFRGDLILVMGVDEMDLLRNCTMVTFALQTKPWLREVDLWRSFVNVGLEFLEGLREEWLD